MAKAPRVHVRPRDGTLYYNFVYQGIRCRETTGLRDTAANRKRCQAEAEILEREMGLGRFDYVKRFPKGPQRKHFTAKPTRDISFQDFALTVWLPYMETKVAESTATDYLSILRVRIFPHIGHLNLTDIRPEHIDRLTNYLKSCRGNAGRLSPRRVNIILLRVRQVLDLASQREYLDKNPHAWVNLQKSGVLMWTR